MGKKGKNGNGDDNKWPNCGCSQQPCPHSPEAQEMTGEALLPKSARGTKPAGSGE